MGNSSDGSGGGAYMIGGTALFDYTPFVDNSTSDTDALFATSTGTIERTNSVVAHHAGTAAESHNGWTSDFNVWGCRPLCRAEGTTRLIGPS